MQCFRQSMLVAICLLIAGMNAYGNEVPAPDLIIHSPLPGSTLAESSFQIIGEVQSYSGTVTLTIDGQAVAVLGNEGYGSFSSIVSFPVGETTKQFTAVVSDASGQASTQVLSYTYDNQPPEITLDNDLLLVPTDNLVKQSPYIISGTITEKQLASFTINDQSVSLTPAGDDSYTFSVPLALEAQTSQIFTLRAKDYSGLVKQIDYSLHLDTEITADILSPTNGAQFVHSGEPITLQILVSIDGLSENQTAVATLSNAQTSEEVTSINLSLAGRFASGDIELPGTESDYHVLIEVLSQSQEVLASTESTLTVSDPEIKPVAVLSVEPQEESSYAEPNAPISIYFNQSIDVEKLTVNVFETIHGHTFINEDKPGVSSIFAKGYTLAPVEREHQALPGTPTLLPGGAGVIFYPERDLAYGADVYVNVNYEIDNNIEELAKIHYNIRQLPTFIEGSIVDQFANPVGGLVVTLEELGRSTVTDKNGGYSFGYGDNAKQNIPSAQYTLMVNPKGRKAGFGRIERIVSVQGGNRNQLETVTLPILNESVAFSYIRSGGVHTINGGEVNIDASDVRFIFPGTEEQGGIHLQFTFTHQTDYATFKGYVPIWLYTIQPMGIGIEPVNEESQGMAVNFELPLYQGSLAYAPSENQYVILLGVDGNTRSLQVVGVGQRVGNRISSIGKTHFNRLEAIGYAMTYTEGQTQALNDYVSGQLGIKELMIRLQNDID